MVLRCEHILTSYGTVVAVVVTMRVTFLKKTRNWSVLIVTSTYLTDIIQSDVAYHSRRAVTKS